MNLGHKHMLVIIMSAKLRLAAFRCAVGKAKLKGERRPLEPIFAKPTRHFSREHIRCIFYRIEGNEVLRKRHFIRNGFHGLVLLYGSCIDSQASHAHHFAVFAVNRLQEAFRSFSHIAKRANAVS